MAVPTVVSDIMSEDVVFLQEDEKLTHLHDAMQLFRFRHMPVVDDDHLVGIVSISDVLRVSASTLLPGRSSQERFIERHFHVRDIMTRDVVTVRPNTPLVEAGHMLQQCSISALPVTRDDNVLVGIITRADFTDLAIVLLQAQQRVD